MSSVLEEQRVHGHADRRHGGDAEDKHDADSLRAEHARKD